jgi:hypothetical protein
MRPMLLHLPKSERRRAARVRGGRRRTAADASAGAGSGSAQTEMPNAQAVTPSEQRRTQGAGRPDIAARRVREAGGPIDMASYVCLCGFAFAAAVSTSVKCPHCGAPQAW